MPYRDSDTLHQALKTRMWQLAIAQRPRLPPVCCPASAAVRDLSLTGG